MDEKLIYWDSRESLKKAHEALLQDKLIVGTTDTILGLFSSVTPAGFEALNRVKGRQEKPYLMLAFCLDVIFSYIDFENLFLIENMLKKFWPGPLTVIFKANKQVASLCSSNGTIAFRIPSHQGIQALLKEHKILFSTSANRSGCPVALSWKYLDPILKESVEWIIVDREEKQSSEASTLIDCSSLELKDGKRYIKIVRKGSISAQMIVQACGRDDIIVE